MAHDKDERSHNQPSHEDQVKGGQHSHQGAQQGSHESTGGQHNQGSTTHKTEKTSHEPQEKGGQQSHSGSQKK